MKRKNLSTPHLNSFPISLDKEQKRFCELEGGAVRLLAPAGCGKTLSLLYRCLHLAEKSSLEKPRFLIFTFTRAARDELRDRLRQIEVFKGIAPLVTVTTLNAWGYRYVKPKVHNPRLITSNKDKYFCINNLLQPVWQRYDRISALMTDSKRKNRAGQKLMDLIDTLKSLGFRHDRMQATDKFLEHMKYLLGCGMKARIQAFLADLVDLEIIRGNASAPNTDPMKHFIAFWAEASDRMYQSALLSLEDQKYWAWIELEKQAESGRYTTGPARYHHILVDEFQDINPLDLSLLKAIATVNKSALTIIGDEDQAIYEWRGATPAFILDPEKNLGGTYETCVLGTNYRSPRNIVQLSQKLIACNQRRVQKVVRPTSAKDAVVSVKRFPTLSDSIDFVLGLVRKLLENKECRNIAMIGRKRSQIIPYQIVFACQKIPFYAAEDLHVFLGEAFNELKGILAMCARADLGGGVTGIDPIKDVLAMCDKIKRYPLAKKDLEEVNRYLRQRRPRTLREAIISLSEYSGPLKGDNAGGRMSMEFASAMGDLILAKKVSEAIHVISEHFNGLQKDYGKSLDDIFYADPPFLYLAEYAARYGNDFNAFYEDVEQAIATLARIPSNEDEENPDENWKLPLHLMTALRAKGKEFDAGIVLDANDGIWPSKLAKSEEELEQERRLFYVAMTRARKYLYFLVDNKILGEPALSSPYLTEIGLSVDD